MDKVFIIAEAGVNHNGELELAYKLIDIAVEAGADAVKFQTFKAETLVSKLATKAKYQLNTTNSTESQYEMIKKLELDVETHKKLILYCKKKNLQFLSSPFDLESIELLYKLGIDTYKIPSGEIINLPYLKKIGEYNKNVIMSTGMANLGEIEDALNILINAGTNKEKITVLHCNTEYPTPFEHVNLRAMLTIRDAFNVKVGYSDHTLGTEISIAAVTMGAKVIEKHFTLSRTMKGPDHSASLEPDEFKQMILSIRNIEKALGEGTKQPSSSELKNKPIVRKSIVAARSIEKGEKFSKENLSVKRPGTGISPMRWNEVIGRKSYKDFKKDEIIKM